MFYRRESPTSTLDECDRNGNTAQKAGGGNSSGLGEFWNTELAKNPALSLAARVTLGPTDPGFRGMKPNNFFCSSEASEVDAMSSSKDM
jgi:hypothetical protein